MRFGMCEETVILAGSETSMETEGGEYGERAILNPLPLRQMQTTHSSIHTSLTQPNAISGNAATPRV